VNVWVVWKYEYFSYTVYLYFGFYTTVHITRFFCVGFFGWVTKCRDMSVWVCVCLTAATLWVSVKSVVSNCDLLQRSSWRNHHQATNPGPKGKEPRANRNVTEPVSAEPLAIGPIYRTMGWVLAANQVRHSTDTVYRDVSPAPGWSWYQPSCVRQLCIWCGSRHDLGSKLRSSW